MELSVCTEWDSVLPMSNGSEYSQMRNRYEADGVVQIKKFLSNENQEILRWAIEFAVENPSAMFSNLSEVDAGQFLFDFLNFRKNPHLKKIIFDPGLNEKLSYITGSKTLRFFHDVLLMKWHQDRPHYVIDGNYNFSVWICLDSVDEENSLAFIPGSHRSGRLFVPHSFKDGSKLGIESEDFQFLTNEKLTDLSSGGITIFRYEPGDAIIFDNRILHRGLRGPGLVQRRAMSLRYAGDGACLTKKFIDPHPPMERLGMKVSEGSPLDEVWFPLTYSRP